MFRNLSETAARDLVRFMRDVMNRPSRANAREHRLSDEARALLNKHGLLTPADDPELAAVFMEDEEQRVAREAIRRFPNSPGKVDAAVAEWKRRGSPARMSYADTPRHVKREEG